MLLPHLHQPLIQENISTHAEVVEIAMKLEASLVPTAQIGTHQIQIQLEAMHLEIQSLHKDKGKEEWKNVWCICCKVAGHQKDQCPIFNDYLSAGGPSLLKSVARPSGTPTLCCVIFQEMGMHMAEF